MNKDEGFMGKLKSDYMKQLYIIQIILTEIKYI